MNITLDRLKELKHLQFNSSSYFIGKGTLMILIVLLWSFLIFVILIFKLLLGSYILPVISGFTLFSFKKNYITYQRKNIREYGTKQQ